MPEDQVKRAQAEQVRSAQRALKDKTSRRRKQFDPLKKFARQRLEDSAKRNQMSKIRCQTTKVRGKK